MTLGEIYEYCSQTLEDKCPNDRLGFFILTIKSVSPAHGFRIKVRSFPNTHGPETHPIAQPLALKVGRGCVYHASIVPNGHVILVIPPVSNLNIMIQHNHLMQPVQHPLAFGVSHAIDELDMCAEGINAVPASDRISANPWVDGTKLFSGVLRRTPRLLIISDTVLDSIFVIARTATSEGERLEESSAPAATYCHKPRSTRPRVYRHQ